MTAGRQGSRCRGLAALMALALLAPALIANADFV
jgi:hypothetical protein